MPRSAFVVVAFGVALLAGSPQSRAADAVPKFDIARNCKAEVGSGSAGIGETMASCTADEERARDELAPQWSTFAQSDKTTCIRSTSTDGSPSYVELQTCLEMTAHARPK